MFFKVTAVCSYRGCGREPSLLLSQVPVSLSRTRQEARKLFPSYPPHTATRVFSSAVVKSVCPSLASGNEGGLQSLVLGNNSLEERPPLLYPPVKRTMVSSLTGGASVAGPGCLVLWCWLSFVVNHSDSDFYNPQNHCHPHHFWTVSREKLTPQKRYY